MSGTLFERYGGFAAVSRVVLDFYEHVLDSDVVGPFFDDVEMRRLMDHQTKFISSLLGGPASYSDERLAEIHAHLQITDEHFNEILALLRLTLQDHGFKEEHIAAVGAEFEARRHLIVKINGPE